MNTTRTLLTTMVLASSALAVTEAQAVTLSWVQIGPEATRTEVFNPAPPVGLADQAKGTKLQLGQLNISTGAAGATVVFTYLGQESGYLNGAARVSLVSNLLTESNNVGDSASFAVAGSVNGLPLDFKFFDSVGGSAINGGVWSANNSIGLIGTNVVTTKGTFAYVLGYNDSATGNLDDWDDFVIGINAIDKDRSQVPEPGTVALLGLGLLGLGFSRRRKD